MGAIALASSNKVLMLENAIYSVISPEGCATILWRDPKKTLEAAKAMKLSGKDQLSLGVIELALAAAYEEFFVYTIWSNSVGACSGIRGVNRVSNKE